MSFGEGEENNKGRIIGAQKAAEDRIMSMGIWIGGIDGITMGTRKDLGEQWNGGSMVKGSFNRCYAGLVLGEGE